MAAEKKYIFDNPKNVQRILYFLYMICGVLFILDFIIHRHKIHQWEGLLGFYSIYGFIGCTAIVLGSKLLRLFVMQGEDYYDREELAQTEEEEK